MKTLRFIATALLAILLGLSGCGEIETPVEPTPDPKPEEVKSEITIDADIITNGLSYTSAKGEKSISFTTNEDWTLSIAATPSGDTWCTASATSGAKGNANVKFTVTENTSYDDRSVSVTIKSGTASKTFTITQKYVEALLLTTNKYELSNEGGSIEIEVKANIDYEMEIAESAQDWITEATTRALSAYKHTVNIATNEEVEKREGEIYFKSGDKVETVKIYQEGAESIIVLSQKEYTVSDAGETISVDIKSNVEYGVQMPDVDWITGVVTRGMSSHSLQYNISPNEGYDSRSAEIIFYDKNSELKDTLKIVQVQKDAIIVAQNEYTVESNGGNLEFDVNTNVDFEVSMSVDWIKQSTATRGLESKPLSFIIEENTKDEQRGGIITISSGEIKQEIKVIQKRNIYFSLSKTEFNLTSNGGDFSIDVSTNGEYSITMPKVEWLTINDNIATSQFKHTFSVAANETYDTRETEIIFTEKETNNSIIVKVVQAYKGAIILTNDNLSVDGKGDVLNIELSTNIEFVVSIPDTANDWISLVQTKSLRTENIQLKVEPNYTSDTRYANITINDFNSELCDTLYITQNSAYVYSGDLTLSTSADVETIKNAGYTKINGNLHIKVSTLQHSGNLIEEVTGNVIVDNKDLVNLDGLYSLKTIGGNLEFHHYNGSTMEGLNNLISIKGDFKPISLETKNQLRSFEGLTNLSNIEGSFIIEGNSSQTQFFKNFKGLDKLSSIGKDFILKGIDYQSFQSLESFEGLSNLSNIGGSLKIDGFDNSDSFRSLTSFKGLEKLSTINGDLFIRADGPNADTKDKVGSFGALSSFEGLNNLTEIKGNLHIQGLGYNSFNSLSSFEGLENLTQIDSSLIIKSTLDSFKSLTSFGGLNKLSTIGKDLHIISYRSLNSLSSFEGLNNLSAIYGDFIIEAESDASPASSYIYNALNSLSSFNGLNNLTNIGGNFRIYAEYSEETHAYREIVLNSLIDFNGLESLNSIGGNFEIESHGALNSLQSFKGLTNLKLINGHFLLQVEALPFQCSLKSFQSFEGLENLSSIGKDFHVCGDVDFYLKEWKGDTSVKQSYVLESLTSFAGLGGLSTIGGDLIIESVSSCTDNDAYTHAMTSLETIDGFSNLSHIGGDLIIRSEITDYSNSHTKTMRLTSIDFNNLTTVGGNVDITGKSIDMTELYLRNLNSVGNAFQVNYLSYASFPMVESIGSDFSLRNIYEVEVMPRLKSVGGDITIYRCLQLYDFCNLKDVLTNFSNTFTVTSCGYNPTKYQILNGQCSKNPEY